MKTKITIAVIGCMTTVFSATTLFSQTASVEKSSAGPAVTENHLMRLSTGGTLGSKLLKSFAKNFKEASGQSWNKVAENFNCTFYLYGMLTRALFDKAGHLVYTITYTPEKNIVADVRAMVKYEYPTYVVDHAFHVTEAGRDIWVISLQDARRSITVRVEGGEMEQVLEYVMSK